MSRFRISSLVLMALLAGVLPAAEQPVPPRMRVSGGVPPVRAGWSIAEGGENLIQSGSWDCTGFAFTTNGRLRNYVTEGDSAGGPNVTGMRLQVKGDFGILAEMSLLDSDKFGALRIFGSLATGTEWWQGLKTIDVAPSQWGLYVVIRDGLQEPDVYEGFFDTPKLSKRVLVEVARQGTQLIYYVNGSELGRSSDYGVFSGGEVYLGMSVENHNQVTIHRLAAEHPVGQPGNVGIEFPMRYAVESVPKNPFSLRALGERRGLLMGAEGGSTQEPTALIEEPEFRAVLGREYASLTTSWPGLYFDAVHPGPEQWAFCSADLQLAFAEANDMHVIGHPLIWHTNLPNWVTQTEFNREEAMALLENHVKKIMARYRGRIEYYVVLNEPIEDDGTSDLRKSLWWKAIGPDYIDMVFRWAREADPEAKLILNDFRVEGLSPKSDGLYNLVKGMRERHVPLDIVGLQGHNQPPVEDLKANMKRLTALGVDVMITEMEVPIELPATVTEYQEQAAVYRDYLKACLDTAGCKGFITWGFTDKYSWLIEVAPEYGDALPLDENYQPKEAYRLMNGVLQQ